ncbi:hypothetical protein [Paenibacillus ihuae]|uniref:hypothetical protein n=1 Tax=Paenibacillus ihuae TaxID=1232431 RepID=UPI00131DAB4D|nr:hypothetical protein [Paenibacillus ihuae]
MVVDSCLLKYSEKGEPEIFSVRLQLRASMLHLKISAGLLFSWCWSINTDKNDSYPKIHMNNELVTLKEGVNVFTFKAINSLGKNSA